MNRLTTIGVLLSLVASVHSAEPFSFSGPTMGTTYSVKVVAEKADFDVAKLQETVDARLEDINAKMSTWLEESELSRFNRFEGADWFEVSPETAEVVALAQDIAERTGGAFDVTVSPLVDLWHFGPVTSTNRIPPTEADIQQTLTVVGYQKLGVRTDPPALRKSTAKLQVDLSAIAKGYAVDEVCKIVESHFIQDYMVEIGGEMRVAGKRSDGRPWTIGIESPTAHSRNVELRLEPNNTALATSGDYRNFFEFEGVRYSHTIDPKTGRPVTHSMAAVSVAASDCATADALATAMLVLGSDDGLRWAEENSVAAVAFTRNGETFNRRQTSHFDIPIAHQPTSNLATVILSIAVFAVALLAMAVGVMLKRKPLNGSCGGLAGLKDKHGKTLCDACQNPSPDCVGSETNDIEQSNPEECSPVTSSKGEGCSPGRA